MKITVRTRSQNEKLYDRMRGFISPSVECIRHTGYSRWEDAASFIHDSIENTDDILLILDEDAFVPEWDNIESLCAFVRENNYSHAGIPDGGLIEHRRHSFLNINPFFSIFNCGIINPIKAQVARDKIDKATYKPEMDRLKPTWIHGQYQHDTDEPYAGIFYWLATVGDPLFLKAETLWDGISTKVLGINNETLCFHSWYSRSYETDPVTRTRIDAIYRLASRNRCKNKM